MISGVELKVHCKHCVNNRPALMIYNKLLLICWFNQSNVLAQNMNRMYLLIGKLGASRILIKYIKNWLLGLIINVVLSN